MRRVGSEADVQWAKALHRGERLRLFPEWSMWVGLTAVTLLIAAPLIVGIAILLEPSLISKPARPALVIPYMISSAILLAFVAVAWGQKLNCAIQLRPEELRYWDWHRHEHRVPWPQVSAISPHFLLWRITLGIDANGSPRRLAIDYGADVRREAIVSEMPVTISAGSSERTRPPDPRRR